MEMLAFVCVNCGLRSVACPECVNTIRIDPETGLPPDVLILNRQFVHNPHPDPEAVKRSVKQPLCDDCISVRDDIMTAEERHRKTHKEN